MKGLASVLLLSFGIYWGLQGFNVNMEDDYLALIIAGIGIILFMLAFIFDKIGYASKSRKKI